MTIEQVCSASLAVREAELIHPFRSRVQAGTNHLKRLESLERDLRSRIATTMWGDADEPERLLDILRESITEAKDWLAHRQQASQSD